MLCLKTKFGSEKNIWSECPWMLNRNNNLMAFDIIEINLVDIWKYIGNNQRVPQKDV